MCAMPSIKLYDPADKTRTIDDTPVMNKVHAALEAEAFATARAVVEIHARIRALQLLLKRRIK
jgi:hypothetical protein